MDSGEDFETSLAIPELIERYQRDLRALEKEERDRFDREKDELWRLKAADIENERSHQALLNLAVHPFVEGSISGKTQSLGYRFVRGSPLSEFDVPNFDALIAKLLPREKPIILIACEVKASVGRPRQVVNAILEKGKALEDRMGFVVETYLRQSKSRPVVFEKVVMVESVNANTMVQAVVSAGANIRVWHGPLAGTETLSLAAPPNGTPNRNKYLHSEPQLNNVLNKLPSLRRTFDIWPKSHPLMQLGALLASAHPVGSSMVVREDQVQAVLSHDMFYLTTQERSETARRLLEIGTRIEFLEPTGVKGEFKVVSRGLRRDSLDRTLQEKWIRWRLRQDFEEVLAQRKGELQEAFRKDRAKYKSIDDY